MPTYEYRCEACGHEFEQFQSITAKAIKKCPKCARLRLRRLIGRGAAVIFRGSGFYQTDYRSEAYHKAAKAEKEAATGSSGADKSTDGSHKSSGKEGKSDGGTQTKTKSAASSTSKE